MRFLLGLSAVVCLAQAPPPPYKASVRLVNVAFTVRDARGLLVNDLTKDDFEVLDDGAPQPISFFARSVDLPLALGLVVDVSGSQEPFVKRHKKDLHEFLKRVLRPEDRAFLLRFGNHLRLGRDYTASGNDLLEKLDPKTEGDEIGPQERRILGTAFYDAIYYATTLKLAKAENGRRAIILFSDGEDNSSAHHMMEAIEAAQAENVVIFGIRYTEVKNGRWNARNKYGRSVMERISHDTGGRDFDAEETDMKAAFHAIDEELRSSYELAYHAPNAAGDGTFHKLVVRVRRPGLTVRAKTGYYSRD